MIRRHRKMRFLGGYYAFPGGKVETHDGTGDAFERCHGLDAATAAGLVSRTGGPPALAYWVAAVRELLEESGVLLACDADGGPLTATEPDVAARIDQCRRDLMAGRAPLADLLADHGWYCDLARLRYLSHFVTPTASPIRFSACFFLCHAPADQAPRLFTEETSEGLWIEPAEAHRRYHAREMEMAEPAEYALAYLAQFDSLAELAAANDGRQKFQGIVHRIDFYTGGADWASRRWPTPGHWPG